MGERIEDKYLAQAFKDLSLKEDQYALVENFIHRVQDRAKTLQSEAKAPHGYYCSICATMFKTPKNCGAGNCPRVR